MVSLKDRVDSFNKHQFEKACRKLKHKHKQVNNLRFKILKTCLKDMNEIGIPVTKEDKELMAQLIELYDKNLSELNQEADRFRHYMKMTE